MPNFEISPDGSSATSDTVRLYDSLLQIVPYRQLQEAEQQVPANAVSGVTSGIGTAPPEIVFVGGWLGSDAKALADRLRNKIADDGGVQQVTVQAVDDSYNDVTHRFNGTWTINGTIAIVQPDSRKDTFQRYEIPLSRS